MIKKCVFVLSLLFFSFGTGHATYLYELSVNGDAPVSVTPYAGTLTDQAYYSYYTPNAGSGNPAHGVTAAGTAHFWLYTNTDTDTVSMSLIFNTHDGGSAGRAKLDVSGMPSGWSWTVMDDPAENSDKNETHPSWVWTENATDGGTMGGLGTGEWDITWRIDLSDTDHNQNISDWYFLSSGQDSVLMDLSQNISPVAGFSTITVSRRDAGNNSPVPEPGSLMLMGAGLLGLAGMVRKKNAINRA